MRALAKKKSRRSSRRLRRARSRGLTESPNTFRIENSGLDGLVPGDHSPGSIDKYRAPGAVLAQRSVQSLTSPCRSSIRVARVKDDRSRLFRICSRAADNRVVARRRPCLITFSSIHRVRLLRPLNSQDSVCEND